MTDETINSDDSTDSKPTYRHGQAVPGRVLNSLLYALGYQQWLSPNADSEYANEARNVCQGIYGALLISHGQYDQSNEYSSEPDWESLRGFREYIFEDHFYVPHLFDDHIEQDTPDGMFDAVEAELVAHGLLHDVPPERDTEYVQPPQAAVEADQ